MRYQYIFFDLDGTLTDSVAGITNSVAYALEAYGIHVEDPLKLTPFVGPPLMDSFKKYYGFTPEQCRDAVMKYREYYAEKGIYENRVYPGITELLQKLKAAGLTLVLATSKPEMYAKKIIRYFGLDSYITLVYGATADEKRTHKDQVIAYAMQQLHQNAGEHILMIGDRENDITGALKNGIDCLGVLYGYGDREELVQAGAVKLADTVAEIADFII